VPLTEGLARITTFITAVTATAQVGPNMVQVTVGGGDLIGFVPLGADQFVYVLAPPAGHDQLTIDRGFTWTQYESMDVTARPVGAYYTVRRWRPAVAEIDLVVVTSGHDGEGARWATRVAAGDPVALWGPRRIFDPPADTERFLLVGDETGVHAIAAILDELADELPGDAVIDVIVEVGGECDEVPLRRGPNTSIVWKHRGDAPAGTTRTLLDSVRGLHVAPEGVYAWGGAESRVMTSIRRHVRDRVGLVAEQVAMTAYWRR